MRDTTSAREGLKTAARELMTPAHSRWNEFCKRLAGPEGCDFHRDESGGWRWRCKGGSDKHFAEAILKTMPRVDVDASLLYFENHGGFCDCEILFNVDPVAHG